MDRALQFGLRVGITKGQGTRTCTRGGCLRLKAVQGLPETYPQMSTVGNGALTDGVVPVTAAVVVVEFELSFKVVLPLLDI